MQCEARIHTTINGRGPRGRRCSRPAESYVCGVAVCDQHRAAVTEWSAGIEQLSSRATETFKAWAVQPFGPFVPEDEQEPIEHRPFVPVD